MTRTRVQSPPHIVPTVAPDRLPVRAAPQALFSSLLRQRRPPENDEASRQEQTDAPEPPPPEAEEPPAARVLPPLRRPVVEGSGDDAQVVELPVPAALAPQVVAAAMLDPDAPWRQVARDVAHTIAAFCNDAAVSGSEGWRVQMELRPDVVADTTLHLTLALHWLTLRFHARDPASHNLLFAGQQELADILETTLTRKRDIAISFEPS